MDSLNKVFRSADKHLSFLHKNTYVKGVVVLVTLMYASLAAPALPTSVAGLFDQTWFKFLFLFLILAVREWSPSTAILIAIGFLISMQTLSRYKVLEKASNVATHAVDELEEGTRQVVKGLSGDEHFDQHSDTARQPLPQTLVDPPVENQNTYLTAKLHLESDESQGAQGINTTPVTGYQGHDYASYGLSTSEL